MLSYFRELEEMKMMNPIFERVCCRGCNYVIKKVRMVYLVGNKPGRGEMTGFRRTSRIKS